MQTFLPYPDFATSAKYLDYRRLVKQRVEAKQIYLALTDPTYGWQNHPAVKMWRGHALGVAQYGWHCCVEWHARGYNDSLVLWFAGKFPDPIPNKYDLPAWFGNPEFHRAHQSNLIRKDPIYYRKFWPDVPDNLPYIWPSVSSQTQQTAITSPKSVIT